MIATAKVIKVEKKDDAVCLFDTVTYYVEEDDEEEERQIVTTLRQDVLRGYLSKESPLGKALLGKKVGDRVCVHVNPAYSYYVVIRAIKKGHDDENIPISSY
jgi:transcription elongation factor GreA